MAIHLNQSQVTLLETYAMGEYEHLIKEAPWCNKGSWRATLERCGDTLLIFLVKELADDEGEPLHPGAAVNRVADAMNELSALYVNLQNIEG